MNLMQKGQDNYLNCKIKLVNNPPMKNTKY